MRYIIQCDNPNDITLGMIAIKACIDKGYKDCIYTFTDGSTWYVRKRKSGWSAHRQS